MGTLASQVEMVSGSKRREWVMEGVPAASLRGYQPPKNVEIGVSYCIDIVYAKSCKLVVHFIR